MLRSLPLFLVTASLSAGVIAEEADLARIKTFLESNCFECHDDDISKGGLNLYELDPESISAPPQSR
jgi:hypothetical protein